MLATKRKQRRSKLKNHHILKKILFLALILTSCLNDVNNSTKQNKMSDKIGIYNIDSSKENMHIFEHFKLELKIENESVKLYFQSSQEFRNSKEWKKGDLYAYSEKINPSKDTLKLNLYEVRGQKKILTEYKILFGENSFQIITSGNKKEYVDNYKKVNNNQNTTYESIEFRDVTQEELKQLDFEYQSGIELIFWLSNLKKQSIDNEDLFNGIIKSIDSINNGVKFPIAEYNSYRDLTHVLGFTLGEILHKDYGWQWKFKEIYNNDYLGFVIVSPDKLTALKVEHYFYDNVMYKRDIKLRDFIEKLNNNQAKKTQFSFYEPWKNKELIKERNNSEKFLKTTKTSYINNESNDLGEKTKGMPNDLKVVSFRPFHSIVFESLNDKKIFISYYYEEGFFQGNLDLELNSEEILKYKEDSNSFLNNQSRQISLNYKNLFKQRNITNFIKREKVTALIKDWKNK